MNRGTYNGATTYDEFDVILYGKSSYVYINSTSSAGNLPTDGAYWQLVAAGGTDGTNGTNGTRGAKGEKGDYYFATFYIDEAGCLQCVTPDEYVGPSFSLNIDGELEVEINGD